MPANSRSACGEHRPSNATSWGAAGWRNAAGRRSRAGAHLVHLPPVGLQLAQLRLQGASFHRSELEGCSFADSDLTSAIFAEVQALRCDFERATLTAQAQKARFSECAMNGAHWGAPADAGGVQGVRSGAGQHGAGRDAGSEPDGTAVDRRPATERPPAWGEASSRRKCAAYRRSVLECDRRTVCASTTGTAAIVVSTANRSKQICISPEESIRRSMPTPG